MGGKVNDEVNETDGVVMMVVEKVVGPEQNQNQKHEIDCKECQKQKTTKAETYRIRTW
jgi:hypothetical protein